VGPLRFELKSLAPQAKRITKLPHGPKGTRIIIDTLNDVPVDTRKP